MRPLGGVVALWTVALIVGGAGAAFVPLADKDRAPAVVPARAPSVAVAKHRSLFSPDVASRAAPFRVGRTPPSARYDPAEQLDAEAPPRDRPPWHLSGILSGDVALAVFEELPGHGNAAYIVTAGDEVDGYRVAVVGGDTAVVTFGTLRWTFTVEPPWR